MKKILIISLFATLLGGCTLPFLGKKQAALQVNSQPQASVYLNGNHVGQTPYFGDNIKPGEYTVRLLVENDPTKDWQTKVTLTSQIVTVIDKVFGATADESANYLLQLEPLPSKNDTGLSILTIPDNVIVKIDGQPEGFSPVALKNIAEGDHSINLTAPGYAEMNIQAQTKKGYKLVISAVLGRSLELTPPQNASNSALLTDDASNSAQTSTTPSPTPKVTPKSTSVSQATSSAKLEPPYVTILDTPTGWLRVRSAPNGTADNEIAKVKPGETYPYLDTNESGWFQIQLQNGDSGWISAQYAKLTK